MENNEVKIGMEVIGNWGAMHPPSYGRITEIKDGMARIVWNDEEMRDFLEPVCQLLFGTIGGKIGLYVRDNDELD